MIVVAGLFAIGPANAQDYAARDVGGWTVTASRDKLGCFLTREFERAGGTTLLLGLDVDGTNHLSVLNANWSIKPREQMKLNFRLSTGGYANHIAVGMASEGKRGFVTTFEAKFPAYFASSKVLRISRGDVPVEQLRLEGSGAAVAELRRCVWIHKVKIAGGGARKDRPDDIPTDPFAPDARRPAR
ncbi:hypothetical protein [Sphingomonas endolithica]|uniref:hypothetical protein n=1 Tax=Sphingomonas endolithica TaxID=2972485 RepID=UPI0021B074A4|nr:hypothetical protein [Sphingomonas sp. ZFBP2030]